jgi:hypothetical protein
MMGNPRDKSKENFKRTKIGPQHLPLPEIPEKPEKKLKQMNSKLKKRFNTKKLQGIEHSNDLPMNEESKSDEENSSSRTHQAGYQRRSGITSKSDFQLADTERQFIAIAAVTSKEHDIQRRREMVH